MAEKPLDIVFSVSALAGLLASRDFSERPAPREVCLELALSVGDISEDHPGPKREEALGALMTPTEGTEQAAVLARRMMAQAEEALETVLEQARQGGPLRVWYSPTPDEYCGLCWLMTQLEPFREVDLTAVYLPPYEQRRDGTVVTYVGWGQMEPEGWNAFAALGEKVSPNLRLAWAMQWRAVQKENGPLRAIVNGQLVSVEEDFYDLFLRRELAAMPEEFPEAHLIGNTLGKYQLGIGDSFLAGRMERLIQTGELEPLTTAPPNAPLYRRTLKKRI